MQLRTLSVERQGAFQIILIGFLVVLLVAILTADRQVAR